VKLTIVPLALFRMLPEAVNLIPDAGILNA
jgi:hypothetical protein